MPNKKWGVAKVKGSRPEQFFIFLALHRSSVRASDLLSEEGLRSDLANRGIKEAEIEALIEHAPSPPALRHSQNNSDRVEPRHA